MKRMGWDDQMRGLQKIVYVPTRDGWRDWWSDERSSNNWSSARTRWRRMRRGWDGMIRWEVFKQLTEFTYILGTDEEDGMEWSDERSSNNWPSSRTGWWRMKRMDVMIRWEAFRQLTKFTYNLEIEGDGMRVPQSTSQIVDVLFGQALWRCFGNPQYYDP